MKKIFVKYIRRFVITGLLLSVISIVGLYLVHDVFGYDSYDGGTIYNSESMGRWYENVAYAMDKAKKIQERENLSDSEYNKVYREIADSLEIDKGYKHITLW